MGSRVTSEDRSNLQSIEDIPSQTRALHHFSIRGFFMDIATETRLNRTIVKGVLLFDGLKEEYISSNE